MRSFAKASRRGADGSRRRGFTLIELMVAVAIVGVLAAIAYPAYTESVRKGHRAEARTALFNLLQQQERYLTQTGCYMTFAAGATGAGGASCAPGALQIPFTTKSGNSAAAHLLSATACVVGGGPLALNQCVMLSAQPPGGSDPVAGTLTLMSTGAKDCTGTDKKACWQ